MDIASHIAGIGPVKTFETGPNTPAPFKGTHTGLTDGTGPQDSSRNMAEIYNRLLFAMDTTIMMAGQAVDHDNWAQLGAAIKSIANAAMPSGCIVMWSGAVAAVPTGWLLCNGANGTPDLRDRFVVGAGGTYSVGVNGGSKDAVVVKHSHGGTAKANTAVSGSISGGNGNSDFGAFNGATGAFSYEGPAAPNGLQGQGGRGPSYNTVKLAGGDHEHEVTIGDAGVSGENANLPPYLALAYIMKA